MSIYIHIYLYLCIHVYIYLFIYMCVHIALLSHSPFCIISQDALARTLLRDRQRRLSISIARLRTTIALGLRVNPLTRNTKKRLISTSRSRYRFTTPPPLFLSQDARRRPPLQMTRETIDIYTRYRTAIAPFCKEPLSLSTYRSKYRFTIAPFCPIPGRWTTPAASNSAKKMIDIYSWARAAAGSPRAAVAPVQP